MDEIAKLRMACQGCDQEVSDDREIPAVVHHPELHEQIFRNR